jgi:uncharacterized protein YegL
MPYEERYEPNFTDALDNFAENPEPRCACVLVLDNSASMSQDNAIGQLNHALKENFCKALNDDPIARKRVEVAIVAFNGEHATRVQDFVTADRFLPPTLRAFGLTPLGGAVLMAMDMITKRKALYRQAGQQYYRPWVFLLTDGEPQGEREPVDWPRAVAAVREGEQKKALEFFSVGVGQDVNIERLKELSFRPPVLMHQHLDFSAMFQWLSDSLGNVSASNPGDSVPLGNQSGGVAGPQLTWGSLG